MDGNWDGQRAVHVLTHIDDNRIRSNNGSYEVQKEDAIIRFREFFRNFRRNNIFIYRENLQRQYSHSEHYIEVDLAHVNEYDQALYNMLQTRPNEYIEAFEQGAKAALKLFLLNENIEPIQVILKSSQNPLLIRDLTANHVNKLIKIPGMVIQSSQSKAKALRYHYKCETCSYSTFVPNTGIHALQVPECVKVGRNLGDCKKGSCRLMADYCDFIDQQDLKLQESPEDVPTGEMPRNIRLTVERSLVDRVSPGTRVSVMAILTLASGGMKPGSTSRSPLLRVVGLSVESGGSSRNSQFTAQEEEEMQRLARDPEIYSKLARSIAPQISGDYTRDIKKAIACLLMGGSRKVLPDGIRLRGDINVLLMGDPSTAKSQFLKFVHRVTPIGVYTSGKGSSAAGLTASVIRDARGEFYLEGGAMVLADGGVICIDEFDKMRETDRVAIHEAMEQQTISIAKAGITTKLNSRTSVLAAANPIYGRYDDLKDVGENIDLMTTILSRFDCIFIVRDARDRERDKNIARHVIGVHMNTALLDNAPDSEIDVQKLKRYITYCRENCAPRLSDDAAARLRDAFVHVRNQVRQSLQTPGQAQVVPITIRQLEALVRLSESLAKMRLSPEATVADVDEALRLFRVSTLAASQVNPSLAGAGVATEDVRRAEDFLKRRLNFRMTANTKQIVEEAHAQGYGIDAMKRAINVMISKGMVHERNSGKLLVRVK